MKTIRWALVLVLVAANARSDETANMVSSGAPASRAAIGTESGDTWTGNDADNPLYCELTSAPTLDIDTTGLATSSSQTTQIGVERSFVISLGAKDDTAASSDTGTFSLIALVKRVTTHLATLIAKDFATTAKQDTGNTSLANLEAEMQCIRPAVATESATGTATTSTAVDAGCTGNAYWAQISNLDRTVDVVVTTPDGGSFNLGPLRTSPRICKAGAATPDNFTVTSVDGSSLVSVIAGCAS